MVGNFRQELSNATESLVCGLLAGAETASWLGSVLDFSDSPNTFAQRVRALRRNTCDNPDDAVTLPECEDFPTDGSTIDYSPFGGVRIQITNQDGTTASPVDLISLRLVPDPFNRGPEFDNWRATLCSGTQTFIADATKSLSVIASNRCSSGNPEWQPCTPTTPTYNPTPQTVNISYEDNSQTTVNEDVDITIFSPQINLIGGIFAPITISGNTFQLAGTVEISPEFKLEVNPEINIGRGGGTDNPLPNPSEPVPEGNEDNGGRVIIGAIVTATSLQLRKVGQISQGGNPDIFIPRLGSLSFYIAVDNGTAWTNDIDIKNLRCYIPCPVPSGAIDVAATAENGVQLDVQPVWGYPSQQL